MNDHIIELRKMIDEVKYIFLNEKTDSFSKTTEDIVAYLKAIAQKKVIKNQMDFEKSVNLSLSDLENMISTLKNAKEILNTLKHNHTLYNEQAIKGDHFSKERFFQYIKYWYSYGIRIVSNDDFELSFMDISDLEQLLEMNNHLDYMDLIDYLKLINDYGYGFQIYKEYHSHIHAKDDFNFNLMELSKYRDDMNGLMASKYGVSKEVYIKWVDQVTNPRCRSTKSDGSPCLNIFTIKHAKTPREFSDTEYTCCHLHRESMQRFL